MIPSFHARKPFGQYVNSKESPMPWLDWYNSLTKPSWTPAPATIGLIWQILYPIIRVTLGFVFVQAIRKKLPWRAALPFAINLVSNLIFTPIQFGIRNLPLAAVDILIVWTTIIWMMSPCGGTTAGSVSLRFRTSSGCRWRRFCN